MHEVSLRAASNRMDAHNLAVVLCPNLVSGPDPIKDVAMCAVPGGPILYSPASTVSPLNQAPLHEGKTTLGAVIRLCIQRYYEVFDEVQDRTEAIPRPWILKGEPSSPGASSFSSGSKRFSGFLRDDDDEIDDGMLVMPVEPNNPGDPTPKDDVPYKPRHKSNQSGGRSVHTVGDGQVGIRNGNGYSQATATKAKSMVSVDNGHGVSSTGMRKGSISLGRGTRRMSGAGVEAISITAGGFFTPPNSVPPVPSLPNSSVTETGSLQNP